MSITLIKELQHDQWSYSQVQEKLLQAICALDEPTVVLLEREGRGLLEGITARLNVLLKQIVHPGRGSRISSGEVQSLIQWMEKCHNQAARNQEALRNWKDEIGIQLNMAPVQDSPEGLPLFQGEKGVKNSKRTFSIPTKKDSGGGLRSGPPPWEFQEQQATIGNKLDRLT